jgi:hypothetical protein
MHRAGNQAFHFIGSTAFSHTEGELRVTAHGTGVFLVSADVNGDGTADFAILVKSAQMPSAHDFLL